MDRSASQQGSESVLIERAFLGDQAAFESLVSRYSPVLFAFVRRHTTDDGQGEDSVQFVWLQLSLFLPQLYQHLSYVHSAAPLRAWLLRVAANRCIDEGRRRYPLRFSDLRSFGLDAGEAQEETLLEEHLVDPSPLPEEVAERQDLQWTLLTLAPDFATLYASGNGASSVSSLDPTNCHDGQKRLADRGNHPPDCSLCTCLSASRISPQLAMESPRLWNFENRLKLLSIVTIVYTFLLYLLEPLHQKLVTAVLYLKCHRTGKRCQKVEAPLYRLRWAISRLWDDAHPVLGSLVPPNLQTIRVLASLGCWTASQKSSG